MTNREIHKHRARQRAWQDLKSGRRLDPVRHNVLPGSAWALWYMSVNPCVGACSATALGDAICRGCGRTFDDVIAWNTLTDKQKAERNQAITTRLSIANESNAPGESEL